MSDGLLDEPTLSDLVNAIEDHLSLESFQAALCILKSKTDAFVVSFTLELHKEPASLDQCMRWGWEVVCLAKALVDPHVEWDHATRDLIESVGEALNRFTAGLEAALQLQGCRAPSLSPVICDERLKQAAQHGKELQTVLAQVLPAVNERVNHATRRRAGLEEFFGLGPHRAAQDIEGTDAQEKEESC